MHVSLSRTARLALLVVSLGSLAVGCGSQSQGDPAPAREEEHRDPHQLVAEGATLLDVRTPEEFGERHLDGAINIPVDQVEARMSEISRDHPVVVYCRSGARAMSAARILRRAGYDVFDLHTINDW
ncbi:MAG: rhodanese-like domain-containing protein [Sandaracinaceae bacterium]|nr:rhodanese-like domain-containing protein [Sandaracinaceae bacterium]